MAEAKAGEPKKVLRSREIGTVDYQRLTVYVISEQQGAGRNRASYGFENRLADYLSDGMYDGDPIEYTIVAEKLDEDTYKKEVEALA